MAESVSVKFKGSRKVQSALRDLGNLAGMGKEAAAIELNTLFRDHFAALHAERHRDRGTGFYQKASDSVFHRVAREGIYVGSQQQGLKQRLYGGRIRPRTAKMLTIPLHPDAFGKRARDSSNGDLHIVKTQSGVLLLGKDKGDLFVAYYLLVGGVDQAPDPTVVPSREDTINVVTESLKATLTIIKRRN